MDDALGELLAGAALVTAGTLISSKADKREPEPTVATHTHHRLASALHLTSYHPSVSLLDLIDDSLPLSAGRPVEIAIINIDIRADQHYHIRATPRLPSCTND